MTSTDWGDAPEVRTFYGRADEVADLSKELIERNRRLIVIQGMRGMGKTRLSLGVVRARANDSSLRYDLRPELAERFDHVVWRSLINAPPLEDLIRQLAYSIPGLAEEPRWVDDREVVDFLLTKVREKRCLIILDNLESLLDAGDGSFRTAVDGYKAFLTRFAQSPHESCLILTTREIPNAVAKLCGPREAGLIVRMPKLDIDACGRILDDYGIARGPDVLDRMARTFGGNPLALELAAKRILEVHQGDTSRFFEADRMAFGEIEPLLEWHFERLSAMERKLANCLAIAREPIDVTEIARDMGEISPSQAGDIISTIQNKILLEKLDSKFTLHPVLIEYTTEQIISNIADELTAGRITLLDQHALYKSLSKDYVRHAQNRLILQPILQTPAISNPPSLRERLLIDLTKVARSTRSTGFAAGNILNLLWASGGALAGRDFSGLTIRSAFLQNAGLADCDFSNATFSGCAFATTLGAVLAVAVNPQGEEVISGDMHGDVRAWRVSDGAELRRYEGHRSWIRTIAFAPDGLRFATGSSDYEVRIWEAATGRCLHVLHGHSEQVYSVDFSPDGNVLASGAEDQTVILWDVTNGTRLTNIEARAGRVRSVRFNSAGDALAIASEDVALWNVREERYSRAVRPTASYVRRAVFSPDGAFLACANEDGTVSVLDGETLEARRTLSGTSSINWLEFSPDGTVLAAAGADGRVYAWQAANGFENLPDIAAHAGSVRAIAFGPDSNLIATAGEDQAVRLWDLHRRQALRTIQGFANAIRGVAWSGRSDDIAAACEDGNIHIWNAADSQHTPRRRLVGHAKIVEAVAFSPTTDALASASDDGTARLWAPLADQSRVLQGHQNWVWCAAFSSDGRSLATGGRDRQILLWDALSGKRIREFHGHEDEVHAVLFAQQDRLLVSGSDDNTIRVWDVEGGAVTRVIAAHGDCVRSLAYNSTRKLLASGSDDQTAKIWKLDGTLLTTLSGHSGRIRSVSFDRSGTRLYTAGDDQIVRGWDTDSGHCLIEFPGHSRSIWSIALDKGDRRLASGSEDGTLRIWDLESGACVERWPARQYEHMNISGSGGLGPGEILSLIQLGAVSSTPSATATPLQAVTGCLDSDEDTLALVMQGGGSKGLAYLGALLELQKQHQFNWYVGTSAGAILATLLAAGYSPDELVQIAEEKQFSDFFDAALPQALTNLIFYGGLYRARTLTSWVDGLLSKKLERSTRVRLNQLPVRATIYAAKRDSDALEFDSRTPSSSDRHASFAVRCSMGLPIIFTPEKDDDIDVFDGGMRHNFPVELLRRKHPNVRFIGLCLAPEFYEGAPKKSIVGSVIDTLLLGADYEAMEKHRDSVVPIDTRPIGVLDFDLTRGEKRLLLSAGRLAALRFLKADSAEISRLERVVEDQRDAVRLQRRWRWFRRIGVAAVVIAAIATASLLLLAC